MISADTTIARLLDEHPGLLDVLVDYHPHFKQLRNRLLRRVMAPRLTVGQAARIAGIETEALLRVLREAAGEAASAEPVPVSGPEGPPADPMPALLAALPESRQVQVDVREDIRRGQEPFARIMAAVTWHRTYAPQAGRGPVPTLGQLGWPASEGTAYAFLTGGMVLLTAAVATGSPAWARAAGALLALGALAFAATLGHVLSHLAPRERPRPAAPVRVGTR